MKFKKGQYVAARYEGDNGDLIAGRVESVRSNGKVLLTNLLTGKTSLKEARVLSRRNALVTKAAADAIVHVYELRGRQEARRVATDYTKPSMPLKDKKPMDGAPKGALPRQPPPAHGEQFISDFSKLPAPTRQYVCRKLWPDVLKLFGIE